MKKIVFLVLFVIVLSACYYDEPPIGIIENYDFENNIEVNSIDEALFYTWFYILYKTDREIWKITEYWQTPEETYNMKTGDCEDLALLFCYILSTFNIDSFITEINIDNTNHIIAYVPETDLYYDPVRNQKCFYNDKDIIYKISYEQALWTTINYHDNIYH